MIVYYQMKRQMKQNYVQSIAQDTPDRAKIDVLKSGHQPYLPNKADFIFTGRSRVNITVARLCVYNTFSNID